VTSEKRLQGRVAALEEKIEQSSTLYYEGDPKSNWKQ